MEAPGYAGRFVLRRRTQSHNGVPTIGRLTPFCVILFSVDDQFLRHNQRLRDEAQELRVQAIRIRLSATLTFCSVVESEARWESVERASGSLEKVQRSLREIDLHIHEPNHVPPESRKELLALLSKVRRRAQLIDASLHRRRPRLP